MSNEQPAKIKTVSITEQNSVWPMSDFRSADTSAGRPLITGLREEIVEDEPFLRALYASVRREELDATGWDADQRKTFLTMQFNAQRETYRAVFCDAQFAIITLGAESIGRIIVDRTTVEIRVVDMALTEENRRRGIGTNLMRGLQSEAATANKPLRLRVHKGSRAGQFYERLGFRKLDESGLHQQLEWRKPDG